MKVLRAMSERGRETGRLWEEHGRMRNLLHGMSAGDEPWKACTLLSTELVGEQKRPRGPHAAWQ